ncbi:hypothetical protein F8M41_005098 [Gigaspora margarita]|uniref:Uncharacterized protein n=1 Tax=Gigaspora margarita TaxID=4874 RepID=A0A8H3X8M8_GIGMA|nr:hypothetical protein F8M41_005098 [Gigaspora margarita]
MIEATDIDYLKTSTISISASESSYSTTADAPSIIDIINNDIDSAVTQNQPKSSGTTINTNFESGSSDDKKNYHTTVEDYQSEEERSDHEDLNEVNNEKVTDLAGDEDLQGIEEEKSKGKKRKGTLEKKTKGKKGLKLIIINR